MFVNNVGICDFIGIPLSAALVNRLYAIIVKSHQQRKIVISAKGMDSSRLIQQQDKSKGPFFLFFSHKEKAPFLQLYAAKN